MKKYIQKLKDYFLLLQYIIEVSNTGLGPIQEKWVEYLEQAHPDQQCPDQLGRTISDKKYAKAINADFKACCLGAALFVLNDYSLDGIVAPNNDIIYDEDVKKTSVLTHSFEKLGLNDPNGKAHYGKYTPIIGMIKERYFPATLRHSSQTAALTSLNDGGVSWREIANIVRKNPILYFSKPV